MWHERIEVCADVLNESRAFADPRRQVKGYNLGNNKRGDKNEADDRTYDVAYLDA